MTDEEKNKVMDRIRKLLAMAADTTSPNEAAIAARRARALMDQYQIAELDLTTVKADDLGGETFSTGQQQTNRPLGTMATGVARLNDCIVRYTITNDLEFRGFLVDAICAAEMMKYLKIEMYRQAERNADGRSDRHAYRLGFASGIHANVKETMREREQLVTANGTALVTTKNQLVKQRFGVARYSKNRNSYQGSYSAFDEGKAQGKRTNLDRQVGGNKQGQLR